MVKQTKQTLFDVVAAVQDCATSDAETVAVIAHLLKSGRVTVGRPAHRRVRAEFIPDLAA